MIISPEPRKSGSARADTFQAAELVKKEVADAIGSLMKRSSAQIEKGKGIGHVEHKAGKYKARLSYDKDTLKVLELDENIQDGKRVVTFKDQGAHTVSELKMKDKNQAVLLRLVEESDTGLMFLKGFLVNARNVKQLY